MDEKKMLYFSSQKREIKFKLEILARILLSALRRHLWLKDTRVKLATITLDGLMVF